jgi:HK97 family phage prohead protease
MSEVRTVDVNLDQVEAEGNRLRGHAAVFNVLSEDLGGFRERLAPGCFAGVLDQDVRLVVNHDPEKILARTKSNTLQIAQDDKGLHFTATLPDTSYARDLRESIKRGDVDGCSFRFTVGDEQWDGDVREVRTVKALHDLTIATGVPAYSATSVELRTREEKPRETQVSETTDPTPTPTPVGSEESSNGTGGLRVEDRTVQRGGLAAAFRRAGFPNETATISWGEFRTATFSGDMDDLAPVRRIGVPLGSDTRYAYPAFAQVAVGSDVTSVQVLRQSSRTLPAAADVVRDIDETGAKPEVDTDTELVGVPLNQVAGVETGIPNIILEQNTIGSLIEQDLRLALNEGLDKLVLDAVAQSDNQDPTGDPLLVAIRKAITVIQASGYNPSALILTPEDAESLDVLQTDGPEAFYVFGAGRFAPGQLFGLNVRVSKTAAAPVVADASAFGRLYISPLSLARFEENAGSTNTSTVRLEGHAAFGVERQDAAVRIAAS